MSKNNGFTSGGFDSFPNLYHDQQRVHEIVTWPRNMLENRMAEYTRFLQREDLMPRAAQAATNILGAMCLELSWRNANGER